MDAGRLSFVKDDDRPVERLVRRFSEDGRLDSSGEFTLSLEKALAKLADFQLANPRHYVLNLLSGAVLSESSHFEAHFNSGQSTFSFDGEPLTHHDLKALFSHVLDPRWPRLQEIGVALLGILRLEPKRFCLVSTSIQSVATLEWAERVWDLRIEDLDRPEAPSTRLVVEEHFSILRATALKLGNFAEREALERKGCYAPLELFVNRVRVSREFEVGNPNSLSRLHVRSARPRFLLRSHNPRSGSLCMAEEVWSRNHEWEAVLYMGESGEVRLEPLHFITNGVLFEGPATLLGIPFVGGVLAAPFRKDLSHSSLIHDSEFIAALEGFKRYAEEMVLRRMLSSQDLPAAVIQVLTEWTPLLLSRFAERGERENQALLERWMEERRFLSDLRSDSAWRSLLTKLAFLPNPAREESARRLRHGLLKAVREYLEWCDLKTVQSLCEKIRELVAFQEKKLLPAAEQSLFIITTLLGQPALDSEYVPGNLRVSALRLKGKISEALEAPGDEQQRSMLTLASGYIEESISRLEALVLTENPQVEAVEALSDAYLLCAQKEKRCQALQFRLEAVRMRATQDPSLEEFLREDLAAIARRCSSFRDFIYWRSRAASSKLSYRPLMEFQEAMQSAEKSLKRGSVAGGAITLRTALVKLEKTFPLLSPYQGAARSRAAHLFRRYGAYGEADQVLARGHLFDRLLSLLEHLSENE